MMPDNWLDKYVGLPWRIGGRELRGGIDCWGLARLVLRDEAGIFLPSWEDDPDAKAQSCRERSRAFGRHLEAFEPVAAGAERVFDLAGFFLGGVLWHVGLLVELPSIILHIEGTDGSMCEDWRQRHDLRRQFGGYWRAR